MARLELYRRGRYWLAPDVRADGSAKSPNLFIWHYDAAGRRNRGHSARTANIDAARLALDRIFLADAGEALAYCPTCGRPRASAAHYLLADAIADYRIEIGDARPSASSIAARLGNVLDFLEATGRAATSCAEAEAIVEPLRLWLAARPIVWRNKRGEVTATRPRTPAAVEEALHQLRAVLRHAHAQKRIEEAPRFKGRPRAAVSAPRTVRADLPTIARFLAYAAAPGNPRRRPLHAFLVGTICTLARPDAVFDISAAPKRGQVQAGLLSLNPAGRVQTRKFRPIVPLVAPLEAWLAEVAADPSSNGWLCEVAGEPIASVKTAWRAMLAALELPDTREWQPYILRHSLATLLRDRGATAWDLSGQLGHRQARTSEIYAVSSIYSTAQAALAGILAELESLAPGSLRRGCAEAKKKAAPKGAAKPLQSKAKNGGHGKD